MKTLKRIDVISDKGVGKIYFTPNKFTSALGIQHDFFPETQRNHEIMRSLGYQGLAVYDFITHKAYEVDLSLDLDTLVASPQSSEMYKIIFNAGPIAQPPSFPGEPGGFMHSLLKYKEDHPRYEFKPDNSYLLPLYTLGQYYSGCVMGQIFSDSKKMWKMLTENQQDLALKDTLAFVKKYNDLSKCNVDELKVLITRWGPKISVYSLQLYESDNSSMILDSTLASFDYLDKSLLTVSFIEICSTIWATFLNLDFKFKNRYCINYKQRLQWVQTLIDSLASYEMSILSLYSVTLLSITVMVECIFSNDLSLDYLNKLSKINKISLNQLTYSKRDKDKLIEYYVRLCNNIILTSRSRNIRDRFLHIRPLTTTIGNFLSNYNIRLTYITRGKIDFKNLLKTKELKAERVITANAVFPQPMYPFINGDESEEDDIEDINEEIKLGCSDDYYEEIEEKLQKLSRPAKITQDIYSCLCRKSIDPINSSISDKIICIVDKPFFKTHKNLRKGKISIGFIPPETAQANGLPELWWPIMYTTDNGSKYISKLNIKNIKDIVNDFKLVEEKEFVMVEGGTVEEHLIKIAEKIKSVEITDDERSEVISRIEKLGLDKAHFISVSEVLENKDKVKSVDSMISLVLGKMKLEGKSVKLEEAIKKAVRSETNRSVLEKMAVMPMSLGSQVSNLPTQTKPLIYNMKLRAEMNSISENLSNNLPSGRFMLTKGMKESIRNTCDLIEEIEDHPNEERILPMIDILRSLEADSLEAQDSLHSDNEGMLNLLNKLILLSKRSTPKKYERKRVIPQSNLKYKGSYSYNE